MGNLKKRVERLERVRPVGAPFIFIEPGETKEEAWKRHLAKHPEDEQAEIAIFCGCSYRKEDTPG